MQIDRNFLPDIDKITAPLFFTVLKKLVLGKPPEISGEMGNQLISAISKLKITITKKETATE